MSAPSLVCREERRRQVTRDAALFGLDYVEVDAAQTTLQVWFLGKAPKFEMPNVRLTGGRPVTVKSFRVQKTDATHDDWMFVTLDQPGDFSPYTLSLVKVDERGRPTATPLDGFDPRYASVTFSFKASCPSDLDCSVPQLCPPPARVQPDVDYLAKDYDSFRQLIFDRLAQTMPDWHETHVPDIGVMLVELLAFAGDHLSYYQDAVATEAYLGTARQRISIRRHARLVDYAMHEGCNARAWLTLAVTGAEITLVPKDVFFCTGFAGALDAHVLQLEDLAKAPPGAYEVFEPLVADEAQPIVLREAHNELHFYTWGDEACCLPKGATRATLADAWTGAAGGVPGRALALAANDVLIFEEVVGPGTGDPADADPAHRQAVRLTKVTPAVDPLYDAKNGGRPVVEIEWCSQDALAFPLCISARMPAPDCTYRENLSVARGNVILVDHGAHVGETLGTVPLETSTTTCATDCEPATLVLTPGPFRPVLLQAPLAFAQPLPPCGCASTVIAQDPRLALPSISVAGSLATVHGTQATNWSARADLLESEPGDTVFVVEIDGDGNAHVRFGNGKEGRVPDAGTTFAAQYRVGGGPAGNVGADTIVHVVFRTVKNPPAFAVRNPLPAIGGTEPEPVTHVRMFAPYAFRDVIERAITADDYAALAADDARRLAERSRLFATAPAAAPSAFAPGPPLDDARAGDEEEPGEPEPLPADLCLRFFQRMQNAKAALQWTGSWYEANVVLDPLGIETVDDELSHEMAAYLEPYRRIGHDLSVRAARYVALDLGVSVCVAPHVLRGHVELAISRLLSAGTLADGTLGLFHPDRLTFGQAVYLSPIVAAVQAVPGVVEVEITRLARYVPGTPAPGATADRIPPNGVLKLGAFEIARLDNDPNVPANGRLMLLARGGR